MKLSKIQMSIIRTERICTVVGVSRSTAYQVSVDPARIVGCIGSIMPSLAGQAVNQDDFDDFAELGLDHQIRALLKY